MSKRYDLVQPRKGTDSQGNEKTYWTNIGSMWFNSDKNNFSLSFNALPVPSMSQKGQLEVRVQGFEPKERGNGQGQNQAPQRRNDFADDIGDTMGNNWQ